MAKRNNNVADDFDFDTEPIAEIPVETKRAETPKSNEVVEGFDVDNLISCLTNERVIVRHINKPGMISNPKHVLFGGMAENATRTYVVPRLSSGVFVNVLTKQEKDFLEYALGLEPNAMSVHRREHNFWDDSNANGINRVRLNKQDNYLDLSNPEDYVRYKILLANKNAIAPSLQELQDKPKATYQFVIIRESDKSKMAVQGLSIKKACYKEYGKIEDDKDKLKTIIEILTGRPVSPKEKLEQLQVKIDELISSDAKMFYRVVTDEYLNAKVLIKKSIEAGLILKRNELLYLASDNSPLCDYGEESTFNIAAKYIMSPKRTELRFMLEEKTK